jgi:hypothetical protein
VTATSALQLSPEIKGSPAYQVLRPSTRQMLRVILLEIDRCGGAAPISHDQFEDQGIGRTILAPGLYQLQAQGLITVTSGWSASSVSFRL